jgi:hypothetical protein
LDFAEIVAEFIVDASESPGFSEVAVEATRAIGDADLEAKDESRAFFQCDGEVE